MTMNNQIKLNRIKNDRDKELYNALCEFENPYEIGNILMHYIVNNYDEEKRVDVIRSVLGTFVDDFLIHELPKGELDKIRKLIKQI
ncbi:hypothetical protein DVW02_15755 [Clostridium botulinum]|nr:hypothetical protein [Clostridium botulinum]